MTEALAWWLSLAFLGLAAYPVVFSLFPSLSDRGYGFAKAIGMLLVSYAFWLLGVVNLLPNVRGAIVLLVSLLGLAGLVAYGRKREEISSFLRRHWPLLLLEEGLFALLFLLLVLVRAYNPEIMSTEQPMDFAFLNAILRSPTFPPNDPWLSGHSISYYYFGYFMGAMLTKLTGIVPSVSYNLALASTFALTGGGVFGLVYGLMAGDAPQRQRPAISPLAAAFGLLGVVMVLMWGNLEGALELLRAHGVGGGEFWRWVSIKGLEAPYYSSEWYPTEHWWWWRATRVIDTVVDGKSLDYTISEFPLFSFLLGDLHPHVMALPFVVVALGLAFSALTGDQPLHLGLWRVQPLRWGLVALLLGALGFLNSWDFPTFTLILLGMGLWRAIPQAGQPARQWFWEVVGFGGVLVGVAVALYLPFYRQFQTQASGVLPVLNLGTRPLHYFVFWGFFVFLAASVLGWLLATRWRRLAPKDLLLVVSVPGALFLAWWFSVTLYRAFTDSQPAVLSSLWTKASRLALPGLLVAASVLALRARGIPNALKYAVSLLFWGFLLTTLTEVFYLRDVFNSRMNTVFKLYYQAWVLLAIGGAASLYYLIAGWKMDSWWQRLVASMWLVSLGVLAVASLVYPVAAVYTKANLFQRIPTLDGLAYVKHAYPAEYEAIQWLNGNILGNPVILEATNGEYSQFARVSTWTGLPTVLGWAGHEVQWRGSDRLFKGRAADIAQLYGTNDPQQARSLLAKYGVRYVYVGRLERGRYGDEGMQKFAQLGQVVFQNREVTIYQVR